MIDFRITGAVLFVISVAILGRLTEEFDNLELTTENILKFRSWFFGCVFLFFTGIIFMINGN